MTDDKRPPDDALDALLDETWGALDVVEPPPDFADRVLAANADATPAATVDDDRSMKAHPRRAPSRWGRIAPALAAAAAAALLVLGLTEGAERLPDAGELAAVDARSEVEVGGRATLVAEAGSALTWSVALGGAAVVEQRQGRVFYRVNRGGPFVVRTPLGDVEVHGTCFTVEVPMSVLNSTAPNLTLQKARTHLAAAAAGALLSAGVMVAVSEGEVSAKTAAGEVTLVAGEAAELRAGEAPRRRANAELDADARSLKEERDALKRTVQELDEQLKTFMIAKANGEDPVVARNRALTAEVDALKAELDVEKELRAQKEGAPFPWPEGLSDDYREDALKARILESLAASGLKGDLDSIDCTEFPCMVYGSVEADDDISMAKGMKDFAGGLHGYYPEKDNSYSMSSWGGNRNVDGQELRRDRFGVAIYPSEITKDKARGSELSRRMRYRFDQYRESIDDGR